MRDDEIASKRRVVDKKDRDTLRSLIKDPNSDRVLKAIFKKMRIL
jgi:hypothetical protein